jgi:NAD(P)-dependent dehydrogenase (short-subunit alcohol dehydrogenase family)
MTDLRFDGRVALVTGGGRGMGRMHSLLLAQRGAQVIVNDLGAAMDGAGESGAPADEVVEEIRHAGGIALADTHDVATQHGANEMVALAIRHFGRLDVVVHNAGIVTFIPFSQMTYQQYRQLVSVHQDGGFLVAKAAWPHMVKQAFGRFVFITSLASMPGLTHYASAKGALNGFARALAIEGASHNIQSNALSVIAYTRLMAAFFNPDSGHFDVGLHGQRAIEDWWRMNLRPEHVSQVVGWLAHEKCALSGETLFTGGGQVCLQFLGLTQGHANAEITPEEALAQQQEILHIGSEFHVLRSGGLDQWLFDRIVDGGAPPLPAPR